MSDAHVIHADGGTIAIAPSVIAQVVVGAAEGVDGARVRRPRRALDVEVTEGSARVALELSVRYGAVLPEIAQDVQEQVARALRDVCGLDPGDIDIAIEELET